MEITVLNRQRGHRIDRAALSGFLDRLVAAEPADEAASMAVCLVSDARMTEFNRRYRGNDSTTDVLSFPGDGQPLPEGGRHLGDVVISVAAARRQARAAGHPLARELEILALHGYLHLLGYDHETDDGQMLRVQRRLVRRLVRPARRGERAGAS